MIKNPNTLLEVQLGSPSFQDFQVRLEVLTPQQRYGLRAKATDQLVEEGCAEIGSSDISCRVYDLYRWYGGMKQLLEALELREVLVY